MNEQLQYQKDMRQWLTDSFTPSHAATLTLLPAFQTMAHAATVCDKFN
jgi:hypothetical protein